MQAQFAPRRLVTAIAICQALAMSSLGKTLGRPNCDAFRPVADPGQSRPMDAAVFQPLHHTNCRSVCSSCNLREICLPMGLTKLELDYVDRRLVAGRRKVPRGGPCIGLAIGSTSLYAVWTGSFKTCLSTADGREQVTGFQLGGELLGLDGIDSRQHGLDAVALEDSLGLRDSLRRLRELTQEVSSLQQQFHRIMSREIVRTHGAMVSLGSMYAEERLAAFLLNLANRLQARGFSATAVSLRMSREEIASFLGLTLGTVSRSFCQAAGARVAVRPQPADPDHRSAGAAAIARRGPAADAEPIPGRGPALARNG